MNKNQKSLEEYLNLPYTIEVFRDDNEEDPGWVARVVELPGCITQADTFKELGEMIEDAMRSWLEVALEEDIIIPEPRPQESYSGKFVVRVPKSLHRNLVEEADREGVSLNQYINDVLAGSVAYPQSVRYDRKDIVRLAKAIAEVDDEARSGYRTQVEK